MRQFSARQAMTMLGPTHYSNRAMWVHSLGTIVMNIRLLHCLGSHNQPRSVYTW